MKKKTMQFKRILVPLLSSPPHTILESRAVAIAEHLDASVSLLATGIAGLDRPEDRMLWLMDENESENRPGLKAPVERITHHHIESRPVAPAVLRYARDDQSDLIMLEAFSHFTLGNKAFGGVAEEIARWAPCPILTLPNDKRPVTKHEFSKILVPIDFSAYTLQQLELASSLGHLFESELHCVHVLEKKKRARFLTLDRQNSDSHSDEHEVKEAILVEMENLQARLTHTPSSWNNHVISGHISSQILELHRSLSIDLIVTSSHGLTDNREFTMGSVAEKLMRRSQSSVFILKP